MPAVGRKNGVANGLLRIRSSVPAFLAYYFPGDGTVTISVHDSGGAWIEDLVSAHSLSSEPESTFVAYIATDSNGAAGDGSIAYMLSDQSVRVIDTAGTVHSFSPVSSGYVSNSIGFYAGRLWWVEFGPGTLALHTHNQTVIVHLRSCKADGTDVTTESTYSFNSSTLPGTAGLPVEFGVWTTPGPMRLSTTAAIAACQWQDPNPDGELNLEIIMPLNGGAATAIADATPLDLPGVPLPSGASLVTGPGSAPSILEATSSAVWSGSTGDTFSVVGSSVGIFVPAQIYAGPASSLGGIAPSPVSFASHPVIEDVPQLAFLLP